MGVGVGTLGGDGGAGGGVYGLSIDHAYILKEASIQ